jgi:REP element-mobilizing transposase RayT
VICRGNERKRIFLDDVDRNKFLVLLAESVDIYQVKLYAYMLMPNHFHLLLQTIRANLSEFMRRFNICYTGWFNHHHGRCGHLYQGRYKALLIDADNYLLEVSRYVHLNVIRTRPFNTMDCKERWRYVRKYPWSTLPGYLDEKRTVEFVSYEEILSMMGGRRAYYDFVRDGLQRGIKNPFEQVKYQTILGDDTFVARIKSESLPSGSMREQPSYRGLITEACDPETILQHVAEAMKIDKKLLADRLKSGVARGVAAELLYRYSGLTQAEIGVFLGGIDYCSVSQLRRRLKRKMAEDSRIATRYTKVENEVRRKLSSVKI